MIDSSNAQPPLQEDAPRLLTPFAVLVINAYGCLLALPVLAAIVIVSSVPSGLGKYLIPLAALAVATFFLPFGFGNGFVSRQIAKLAPPFPREHGFVMQLTTRPRRRSGPAAWLEDADDIGYLFVTDEALVFYGDAVRLSLPWNQIKSLQTRNIGLRGLYLYGARICLETRAIPGVQTVEFAERCSMILPGSKKLTRTVVNLLAERVGGQKS